MKIINLLPKHKQEELRYEDLFHTVGRFAAMAGILLLLVLVIQIGVRFYLDHESSSLASKIEQTKQLTNKEENNDLKSQIKLINAQMSDFKTLAASTPAWSKVLVAFARLVPDGVRINGFTAEIQDKQIIITGQSPTRDQVIALYNNIHNDATDFHDIDYPLENVAEPTNVSFHFTFFIQDQLLKTDQ